ncbi:MAG: TRAP transporter small permease [Spirochaetales bacterium]|nr:TRAP transporter small permease [Spirochaetales bacterium]
MKKVLEWINGLVLVGMYSITILTVIFRVILKIPASWSEELAQYSFIFLGFIGAAAVMEDEGHIKITFLVDRLSAGFQKALRIAGRFLMMGFLIPFTIGAWGNVKLNWVVEIPTAPWMRIGYMYLVLFLSGLAMLFYLGRNTYRDIKPVWKNTDTSSTPEGGMV